MILPSLYTKQTAYKGWGVFSQEDIPKNTIIEISPVIVMTNTEKDLINKTILYHYIFDWVDDECCMAMGLIPVYNHAYISNCEYFQDYEKNTIMIKTVRNILADEELTINYNGDYNNPKKVWFDVHPE